MIAQRKSPVIRMGPRLAGFPPDGPNDVPATNVVVSVNTIPEPPAAPTKKKRGRPPKSGVAMTPAERKAASRLNLEQTKQDKERRDLIARLVKIYDRQALHVTVTGHDRDAESRAEDRRASDRIQRRQYLENLKLLTLSELKLTAEGKNVPDSRGRLPGEMKSGGHGSRELGNILDAELKDMGGPDSIATPVKPEGRSPDNPKLAGTPGRWMRVSAKELEKQSKLDENFRKITAGNFDSGGHCTVLNCSFTNSDSDAQVEHFRSEYYAGEKLWDRVDELADPDVAETLAPLLPEARRRAAANVHHWIICGWLRSRT
jgi:hypothetical protein